MPTNNNTQPKVCRHCTLTTILFYICSEVSVSHLREAILTLDPNRPEGEVDQTIGIAFSISSGQLIDDTLVVSTEQLAERLGSFPVFR